MSYIVIEQNLIESFFKFFLLKSNENEIILKLLNHFKPFVITDKQLKEQLEKFLGRDNPLNQRLMTSDSGLWKTFKYDKGLYTDEYYKEMLEKSKYKILLTTHSSSFNNLEYHKICIEDKPTHIYAKKFDSGSNRDEAKKHIISLMKNANKITIIDKFLYKDNIINNLISWFNENALNQDIEFTLKGQKQQLSCNTIESKFKNKGYKVICQSSDDTTHDRYIIIDNKISINLTSGLENLFSTNKDFTYIISEK